MDEFNPKLYFRTKQHMDDLRQVQAEKRRLGMSSRRRRSRVSEEEIIEAAETKVSVAFSRDKLEAMEVLRKQMRSADHATARAAAVKIIEYTDGKPTQTVVEHHEGVHEIVYRTAALEGAPDVDGELAPVLELVQP